MDVLLAKIEQLGRDPDIEFHFIGHLQSNKAKMVANKISCLHSLDSLKTARLLDEVLEKPLDCYVELYLTENENKSGVEEEELASFLEGLKKSQYPCHRVHGHERSLDGRRTEKYIEWCIESSDRPADELLPWSKHVPDGVKALKGKL